jgi:hypothetical protein
MFMFYHIREATYGVSKDRGFETIIPGTNKIQYCVLYVFLYV